MDELEKQIRAAIVGTVVTVIFLGGLAPPVAARTRGRTVAVALAEARALARRHRPDLAAERLRADRQLLGDDPAVLLALARLDEDLEDYSEAEQVSRRELSDHPQDSAAALLLAEALVSQGHAARASAIVRSIGQGTGLSPGMQGRLGLLGLEIRGLEAQRAGFFALIQYGRSVLSTLQGACRLAPDSAQIRYALGRYYLLAPGLLGGDLQKAQTELGRSCRLDPACFECRAWALAAHVRAGAPVNPQKRVYEHDFGRLPEARSALTRALTLQIQP